MIELRPYQRQFIEAIRQAFREKARAPLGVLPTGGGKTVAFCEIARGAKERGNTVAILAHRVELIDQIISALSEIGVTCDVVAAGYARRSAPVMVASVHTLVRRVESIAAPDLVVADECHHMVSGNTWGKIMAAWSSARLLGVTATPIRLDGRGLAAHFDRMIIGPSVSELTEGGYLAPARVFAPPTIDVSGLHTLAGEYIAKEAEERANKPSVTGDALSHYRQHADGAPALVFCVSVKHADDVAAQFRDAGYSAVMLKGGMDRQIRRDALKDFRRGAIQVITSVDIFCEGVDLPGAHVGIILRPTQSLGLWRQMIGRILRPCEGKTHAVLLDHAANCQRHGLPTDEPEWKLAYDETKRKRPASISVRVCPKCFAASSSRAFRCSNCGEVFKVAPRTEVEEREGELVEITPEMRARKMERRHQGMNQTLEQLREYAARRGFKAGWADHVYAARQAKKVGR